MQNVRTAGGGVRRWLLPLVLLLALGLNFFLVYAYAAGSIDETHRNGLSMIVFAFLFMPSNFDLLTSKNYGALWLVRSARVVLFDAGLRLFFFVFGLGAGLAMMFGIFGTLANLVYGIFLALGLLTAAFGIVTVATSGKLSGSAER